MKAAKENIVRFDVELSPEQSQRLNELCKMSHRSRKNFAEAVMMAVLNSKDTTINLNHLGIINQNT